MDFDFWDWLKITIGICLIVVCGVGAFFFFRNIYRDINDTRDAEIIKTELEIENLKLDNELKKIQLEQLGFDFSEFEISNIGSDNSHE